MYSPRSPRAEFTRGCVTALPGPLSSAARALVVDVISEVLSQAQLEATYAIGLFFVSIYSALWYMCGIRRLALTEIIWWKCRVTDSWNGRLAQETSEVTHRPRDELCILAGSAL